MLAYEFYYQDHGNQHQLIGILPERRKDQQRITRESIMNWGKMLLGSDWNFEKINYVEVFIDKMTGELVEVKQNVEN